VIFYHKFLPLSILFFKKIKDFLEIFLLFHGVKIIPVDKTAER